MFSDTGKQNILLPGKSNNIRFFYTGKQSVLLPDESNKIMFMDTGKQNILLPGKSDKIMFSDHWEAKRFASWQEQYYNVFGHREHEQKQCHESNWIKD